jgi:hypothetical protein
MNVRQRIGALLLAAGMLGTLGTARAEETPESLVTFERHIQWNSDASTQSFPQDYSFSLPVFSELSVALMSIRSKVSGIDNFSLSLFNGDGALFSSETVKVPGSKGTTYQFADWSGWLAAGNYTARVGGNLVGGYGSYELSLLATAPVPEPGEWLMLGIGLLAIGAVARRRMQS